MQKHRKLTIEEIRSVQLSILSRVLDACKLNNIKIFGYFGTLLGAVRHSGYIPWDDDIDLALFRVDYERLKLINWESHGLALHVNSSLINSPYPFIKLIDPEFPLVEEIDCGDAANGVNIDIFPLDYLPDSLFSQLILRKKIKILMNLIAVKVIKPRQGRSKLKSIFLSCLKLLIKPIEIGKLTRFLEKVVSKNTADKGYAGVLVGTNGEKVKTSWFSELDSLDFEGNRLPCPTMYHEVLQALYGDYMTLPKKEERITHHAFEAYTKIK